MLTFQDTPMNLDNPDLKDLRKLDRYRNKCQFFIHFACAILNNMVPCLNLPEHLHEPRQPKPQVIDI